MNSKSASSALQRRAQEIVTALDGHWSREQGMCRCPAHNDRTPSLSIGLSHDAILFHCFAGCSSTAVLEGFKRHGIKPRDLFDGGGGGSMKVVEREFGPNANAVRLWHQALPLSTTLAERYLDGRSIALRSSELRYHHKTPLGRRADVRFLPALIAAVRMDIGIVAIQRSFLDPMTGAKARFFKPKRALGSLGSGAVRLAPPENGRLGLAEGSESALSATILHDTPCWPTLGNERFGIVAVPESVTELHLFVDADKGGELALKRGIEAHDRPGRLIIPHVPARQGYDWNDELREHLGKLIAA